MGLLNSMTVKYSADLSGLKAGSTDAKSNIATVVDAVKSATSVFKQVAGAVDGAKIVTGEDVAQAKLTLIESKVAEAREKLQTLQNTADAGEAVTGIPEADAQLTLLEDAAQQARTDLAELGNQAEETGSGMSGFFSKIGGLGGGLLDFGSKVGQSIFGLQAMGQAAVSMVGGLFSSSQQIEEATSSFQVFDGSMQAAQKEMGDLSSFAAHTPFETSSIDDAALKMQSVGINAKDVIPDIHALGDALDATGRVSGADLDMIVSDFDKIQTTGHLTTDVMNSFALQGIDAWSVLEKQTGKTRAQLGDMISKGLFPAKDAMADLTAGIEKNPLYTGQMANDTNSMTGIMSTLKSNWDQALASFASPVMKDLEPVLNDISTDLSSPGFKQFATDVGSKIAGVFGNIATAAQHVDFKSIGDQVQKLGTWFKTNLQPALEKAEPDFAQLGTTIGNLASSALPPLLKAAGDLAPKVVTLAGDIAGGLNTAIVNVTGSFNTWGPIIGTVGGILTVVFIPAIIKSGVESAIAGGKLAGTYITNIVKTGAAGWEAAGKIGLWIGSIVKSGAEAVIEGAKIAASWTANTIKAGASAVADGAKIAISWTANTVKAGASAVADGAKIAASWTANTIKAGASAVADGAKIAASFVANMVKAGIEAVTAGAKIAASFVANIVASGASAVVSGVQITANFIASIVESGVQAGIAGAKILASFVSSLVEAGAQAALTAGTFLVDLIPSIVSFVAETLVAAATAIPAILIGFGEWIVMAGIVAIENIIAFWPIYLIIAAIIIVVGIVILIIKNWGAIIGWLGEQWQRFVGFIQLQIKIIGEVFSLAGKLLHDAFSNAWNWITGIFSKAGAWFHDHVWQPVVDRFTEVFTGLKNKATGIWSSITDGVKGAFNTVITLINNGISGINNVSSKVGIPAIPLLPHLSAGGVVAPGTFAIAGDPGPNSELIYGGTAGATVFSHGQSQSMLSGGSGNSSGGRGETHVHIHLDSQEIAQYSAEATADIVVKKLFGHGPVRSAA